MARRTTESGQCVILRRLRKTRRPPARFASDGDLKIEGRRRVAEGRMPIAPSATLFSIRPSPLSPDGKKGIRAEREERGHFASRCGAGISMAHKCELEILERERIDGICVNSYFSMGLSLFFVISLQNIYQVILYSFVSQIARWRGNSIGSLRKIRNIESNAVHTHFY